VSENQHIQTIKAVYEAFGRGDVDAIVATVTDDVDWSSDTGSDAAPWYGSRRGPSGVVAFFADNGDDVLTVVRFRARSRATGKSASMQLHHWFHFRGDKIDYYRGTEDTAITLAALAVA
jgi:ketosteroid isomerase-like protein